MKREDLEEGERKREEERGGERKSLSTSSAV